MRTSWLTKVIFAAPLVLFVSANSTAASFPVFTFNDPFCCEMNSAQMDSALNMFEDFGIDWIVGTTSKSLFSKLAHRHTKLVPNNGLAAYHPGLESIQELGNAYVRLDTAAPAYLWFFASNGVFANTFSPNLNSINGYRYNHPDSAVGEIIPDPIYGQQVAWSSSDSEIGYFFKNIGGKFQNLSSDPLCDCGLGHLTMKATMRVGDTQGSDTTTIAQLIVRNTWAEGQITHDDSLDGHYFTEVVDDTLLVYHGNGSVVTSIDTIPTNSIINDIDTCSWHHRDPNDPNIFQTFFDTFPRCWRDSEDTLLHCDTPRRYTKTIRLGDFHDSTNYRSFEMNCLVHPVDGDQTYPWYECYRYAFQIKSFGAKDCVGSAKVGHGWSFVKT